MIEKNGADDRRRIHTDASDTDALLSSTNEGIPVLTPPKGCNQQRYLLAVLAFIGNFCCYALRVNLSVAIVGMVNHTAISGGDQQNYSNECPVEVSNNTAPQKDGEFVWNQGTQGIILGSFFWGYIVTQIPGGWVATRYSAKWTFGIGILWTGILTLLTPIAARQSVYMLILVRVLEGLGEGATYPALNALLTRWCPPLERTQISTIAFIGMHMGTVIAMPVTGLLCTYGFAGGWPSAFYVFGLITCVWFVFWCFLAFDGPELNTFITREERLYIQRSIGTSTDEGKKREPLDVPWCDIFASVRLWAILFVHVANNWGFYTLLTSLPLYMSEVLHYNITENSFLSALPYLAFICFGTPVSFLADFIRRRSILSTTAVRKIACICGLLLPAVFLISAGYVGCDRRWAVACVIVSVMTSGLGLSGYQVNHMDIAPRHAGVLVGITNTFATIPGMLGPYVVGLLTNNQPTHAQWQIVFYICAAIYLYGAIFYAIFGTGTIQTWNEHGRLTDGFKKRMVTVKQRYRSRSNYQRIDDLPVPTVQARDMRNPESV